MKRRKRSLGPDTSTEKLVKRTAEEVFEYWSDEMMATAVPVSLDRPVKDKSEEEKNGGKRSRE